jgi:microcystin-dependent protein
VERITKIRILDEPIKPIRELKEGEINLPKHMAEHIYMFAGESTRAKFKAKNYIIDQVIDWYGTPFYDNVGKDGWVPCGGFCGDKSGQIGLSDSQKTEIQKWKIGYGENNIIINTKYNEITSSNYYNYILIESITVGSNTISIPYLSNNFVLGAGIPELSGSIGINPGETGGEAEVTLTAKQSGLPSHTHTNTSTGTITTTFNSSGQDYNSTAINPGIANPTSSGNIVLNTTVTIDNNIEKDASQAHNNIPPYVALWKLIKVK